MTVERVLEAERVEDLADLAGADTIVAVGFAEHGRPTMLVTPPAFAEIPFGRTGGPREPSFPRSRTENPYPARAIMSDGSTVDLGELTVAFPFVQPLPHGELLVVGGRCRSGHENAEVFTAAGRRRRSFCAGDGIESVQVSRSGQIWVSYFDEGVFGNLGWGGGRGPDPVGASGLVCFASDGTISYRFAPPAGHRAIADCYALNVGEDAVWAYYYTDFDLVLINRAHQSRAWATPLSGAKAVAVHGGRALLFGGYAEERNAVHLCRLDRSDVADVQRVNLVGAEGQTIAPDVVVGRGRCLHMLVGSTWWRFDLATLPP